MFDKKFSKCCLLLSNCERTRTEIFASSIPRHLIKCERAKAHELFLLHNFSLIKTTSLDLYTFDGDGVNEESEWRCWSGGVVVMSAMAFVLNRDGET